jgi:hypothetical protein
MSRRVPTWEEPPDPSELLGRPVHVAVRRLARLCDPIYPAPWFYSNSGDGRFDLLEPTDGTCYFASDIPAALREKLGPTWKRTIPVLADDLKQYRAWLFRPRLTRPLRVPRITDDAWQGLNLTLEACADTDYPKSNRWATALFRAGYTGLRYSLRHAPAARHFGLALFGRCGSSDSEDHLKIVSDGMVDDRDVRRFATRFQIAVGGTIPGTTFHLIR